MISEYEREVEILPGLRLIAREVLHAMRRLDLNQSDRGISPSMLKGNPYWPAELAALPGILAHERCILLLPLAISRTQDDKGRVRWTFFGGSEQGPDRAFWRSFYDAPGRERPAEMGVDFMRRLLHAAYGEIPGQLQDLRRAGFRILPGSGESVCPRWKQDPLPAWTLPYLMSKDESIEGVRYLLTFRPFGLLPEQVRKAYLAARLHLLPFPGSLIFWGAPNYLKLASRLPLAMQIPLLKVCERHEAPRGLRIPQSGWLHEPHPDAPEAVPGMHKLRNTFRRTHRWERLERHEDVLATGSKEDRMARVLFSSTPDDIDLYNKPMARSAQIWTDRYELLLDGPRAGAKEMRRAANTVYGGGHFGYRFFPAPMMVGRHEVFWHLPLAAFVHSRTHASTLLDDSPSGYLTAYGTGGPDGPIELWPEFLHRPEFEAAGKGFEKAYGHRSHTVALNAGRIIETQKHLGLPFLPGDLAGSILTLPRGGTVETYLEEISSWKSPDRYGYLLYDTLRRMIGPQNGDTRALLQQAMTYRYTANRRFEEAYWRTIVRLATGRYRNKDNADCVDDPPTKALLRHKERDLEALGTWLLSYYARIIQDRKMEGKAIAGDLPFGWRTEFAYPWMKGWHASQSGTQRERNLLVMIPGKDRSRAVILADHYDTAYMEDLYYKERGGTLARIAAAGADDNHSATAALMLGAPVFMDLSRAGNLECDVWLIHLTGEEFPADSLGARHLAQSLVEGTLRMRVPGRKSIDLSGVRVEGMYVMDMIAHNRNSGRDVFQISPGEGRRSYRLAYQAHCAAMIWNASTEAWNAGRARRHCSRGKRSVEGTSIPALALHPRLRGEVRVPNDPRSSLFNTDGQVFSDAGIPVVLFMENYDINRVGYHDSQDTMSNIDLDYGAAIAAIAIETVARVAHMPGGILR